MAKEEVLLNVKFEGSEAAGTAPQQAAQPPMGVSRSTEAPQASREKITVSEAALIGAAMARAQRDEVNRSSGGTRPSRGPFDSSSPTGGISPDDFKSEMRERNQRLRDRINAAKDKINALPSRKPSVLPGKAGAIVNAVGGPIAALALAGVAVAGLATAARAASLAIGEMTDQATNLNAQVARQSAIAERDLMLAQRRRANRLSDELSSLISTRSSLAVTMTEITGILTERLLPLIEGPLQIVDITAKVFLSFLRHAEKSGFMDFLFDPGKIIIDTAERLGLPTELLSEIFYFISRNLDRIQQLFNKWLGNPDDGDLHAELDKFFDPSQFVPPIGA